MIFIEFGVLNGGVRDFVMEFNGLYGVQATVGRSKHTATRSSETPKTPCNAEESHLYLFKVAKMDPLAT